MLPRERIGVGVGGLLSGDAGEGEAGQQHSQAAQVTNALGDGHPM